jgi:hypothetical protein
MIRVRKYFVIPPVTGNLEPISAYVSAPHKATSPPANQAEKKIIGVGDAAATFTGVRKIPMPITRLTTIIVKSKSPSLFFSLIL